MEQDICSCVIPLRRPRHGWEGNIEMGVEEYGCGLNSLNSGWGPVFGCCACGNELSGSTVLVVAKCQNGCLHGCRPGTERNSRRNALTLYDLNVLLKVHCIQYIMSFLVSI